MPCLPSLLSVRHPSSPERPVPKLTSLIYLFISLYLMAVNDAIAFFLFFHLPSEDVSSPLLTVQWQLHPWLDRECAAAKLGPNFYTWNVFLSLYVSFYLFVWNNQLQYLVMGMSNVIFVCMICHNCFLTSLSPAMFSGCISPCIRPGLNIKHELSPCAG